MNSKGIREMVALAADFAAILTVVAVIVTALVNRLQPNARTPDTLFWAAATLGVVGVVFVGIGVLSRLDVLDSFDGSRGRRATAWVLAGAFLLIIAAGGFLLDGVH